MLEKPVNVLFLCTHNSARSILAEAILNHVGKGRFKAFSAGSSPRENQQPNPMALKVLESAGISTAGLRSKTWDEFATADAPPLASPAPSGASPGAVVMDLVITVCDNAAGEVCPFWPGHPATAHWGYADPSASDGSDAQKMDAFRQTLLALKHRLQLLTNLPTANIQRLVLEKSVRDLATS